VCANVDCEMDPSVYAEVLHYVSEKQYRADATKDAKRRIREKAQSFFVRDNLLHHNESKGKVQRVVQASTQHRRRLQKDIGGLL